MKLNSKLAKKRIEDLLSLFNIEPIRKRYGIQLSGGERRRVEIARALVAQLNFYFLMNHLQELTRFLWKIFKTL